MPWRVPPQKRSPPAVYGPTLGIVFSKARASSLRSGPERMKLSIQSVLGWVSRRAKHDVGSYGLHAVAVAQCPSLLTQYPSVGSRVESVLCQEDARVALVENAYCYLVEER